MKLRLVLLNLFILILSRFYNCENEVSVKTLVFTVASDPADGYLRYLRSARQFHIPVTTLGMHEEWRGGNMESLGGGYKLNLLKEALKPYKDAEDLIILFTDAYDVVFTASLEEIVTRFKKSGARLLISAENLLWPDKTLKSEYPKFDGPGGWYLNSGSFIGYANTIYEILKHPIKNSDDDQLFLTKIYLDETERTKHQIQLDHTSEIFQNLNGALDQVMLQFDPVNGQGFVYNAAFNTKPIVIHGNGPSKLALNNFGNYLAGAFSNKECKACKENRIHLVEDDLPVVSLALFVVRPTPFVKEFFEKIYALNYPKENLHLFVHNNVAFHKDDVQNFILQHSEEYKSFKFIDFDDQFDETATRNLATNIALGQKVDYLFTLDAEAHIDDPDTLRSLIQSNYSVIAPMLTRYNQVWSNFWGAITPAGYYARSHDYMDIVKKGLIGVWNVPYIAHVILAKASVLPKFSYDHPEFDPDMALCFHLRQQNVFMFVSNLADYGHLVNVEHYDIDLERPDFYELFTNKVDWERRYIHPNYTKQLADDHVAKQPCPDVYWFPIATEQFCDDMVAIMENFGRWSDGSNDDQRLQGGYEAVPTRDIHMNQVGLEPVWMKFLQDYVRPLQEKVFTGYFHDPPRSLMNFVVRYKPDEQPFLRPHHDSSTYTINLALNKAGVDYEGGGCKFLRYNCSVTDTQKGWLLMHPGRLTHFHEGLLVTKGTRYIMISFVDP